jgi:hypothetical protein
MVGGVAAGVGGAHSMVGADRPLEGGWVQSGAPYLIANVRTLLEPTTLGLAGRGARRRRTAAPAAAAAATSTEQPSKSSFFAAAAAEEGGEEADALRLAAAATHAWGRDAEVDALALSALIPRALHGSRAQAPSRTARARVGVGGALTMAMPSHRGISGTPSHTLDLDGGAVQVCCFTTKCFC